MLSFYRDNKFIIVYFMVEKVLWIDETSRFLIFSKASHQNNVFMDFYFFQISKHYFSLVKCDDIINCFMKFLNFLMMRSTLIRCSCFDKLWHSLEDFHLSSAFKVVDYVFWNFKKLYVKFSFLDIPFSWCLRRLGVRAKKLGFNFSFLDWPSSIEFFDRKVWIILKLSFKHLFLFRKYCIINRTNETPFI